MIDHEELVLAELRRIAAEVDGPPHLVLEAARAAFLMRRLDAELAELVADSAIDDGPVLVRGVEDGLRLLSFETDRVSVEVQVTEDGERRSLLGQVEGASGEVEVETSADHRVVVLDDSGRFTVEDVPSGTVRLHLVADDGSPVTTSWVSL